MKTKSKNYSSYLHWCIVILAGATATLPLFLQSGFLNTRAGGDSPFLLIRLHELAQGLVDGQFPVRWMGSAAYGLGYPFFHYYAALPFYLAAVIKRLGASYVLALKLTQLFGAVLAAGAMAGWVTAVTGNRTQARLAALAYSLAPFHLVNLYVRGDSLGEFWAMAFYPLCLWAVTGLIRALRNGQTLWQARLWWGAVGLSYGGLTFCHNISALNFSPFLGFYALLCMFLPLRSASGQTLPPPKTRLQVQTALAFATAIGLGLALSAFFWLPALREKEQTQLDVTTQGYLHYSSHFRTTDLVQSHLPFEYDPAVETPFAMGLVQASTLALGVLLWGWQAIRQRQFAFFAFVLLAFAFATLMITPYSAWLWEHLPLVSYSQFPWRFLSIQAVWGAMLVGGWANLPWPSVRPLTLLMLVVVIIAAAFTRLRPDFIPLTDNAVTAQAIQQYEHFTGNIGTTIRGEYLPSSANPRPYTAPALFPSTPHLRQAMPLRGQVSLSQREFATSRQQVWRISAQVESDIAIPLNEWAGWQARLDGQVIPVQALPHLGWVQVTVPAGEHRLQLELVPSPLHRFAEMLSLLAWLGVCGIFWAVDLKKAGKWLVGGVALLLVCVVLGRIVAPTARMGVQTMDFSQLGWAHTAPVPFQDGSVLLGAQVPVTAQVGEQVQIQLTWQGAPPPYTLSLESAAGNTLELTLPYWQAQADSFQLPTDLASGLYYPVLRTPNNSALTSGGQTRNVLYLSPIVVGGLQDYPTQFSAALQPLAGFSACRTQPDRLLVRPLWNPTLFTQRLQMAVRLLTLDGTEIAALDTPAGLGNLPTELWATQTQPFATPIILNIPPDLRSGVYLMRLALYADPTAAPLFSHSQRVTLAQAATLTTAEIAPTFAAGSTVPYRLVVTAPVHTVSNIDEMNLPAVRYFWRMEGAQTVQWAAESGWHCWQASSDWQETGELTVPSDTPAGSYALSRVHVLPNGHEQAISLGQVTVTTYQPPQFPPMQVETTAEFGALRLGGYDSRQSENALALTFYWQAQMPLSGDYHYFVHLVDTAQQQIVAQVDGVPQQGTLPTWQWQAGQIVVESVTLDLQNVPAGEYQITVGWYDPQTGERLPITAPREYTLSENRYLLQSITR
ncbi:MAG TPA: hypothetical protein PK299_09035 [Anaerolineales bacterium]|nr:hypothetical protein [Anaerolineales bacterium]